MTHTQEDEVEFRWLGVMIAEAKDEALKRLSYIYGRPSGIGEMLEEDKYCVDVLRQTDDLRPAIENMVSILIEAHLHTCAVYGIKSGRDMRAVGEFKDIYVLLDNYLF